MPRILSGYQKSKNEEEQILASLREEGLLAKPGGRAQVGATPVLQGFTGQGGISFEIVDVSTVVEDSQAGAPPLGVLQGRRLR